MTWNGDSEEQLILSYTVFKLGWKCSWGFNGFENEGLQPANGWYFSGRYGCNETLWNNIQVLGMHITPQKTPKVRTVELNPAERIQLMVDWLYSRYWTPSRDTNCLRDHLYIILHQVLNYQSKLSTTKQKAQATCPRYSTLSPNQRGQGKRLCEQLLKVFRTYRPCVPDPESSWALLLGWW